MSHGELQLIAGNATPKLAGRIAEALGLAPSPSRVGRFPDGEIDVQVNANVRGNDVFIIQSTSPPVNDSLMELLILIDAVRRASASRITAVIPYFGYARKDRKDEGRVPITAKLVANLLVQAGAQRVLTVDLHAAQIQGFFDIPVDHLYAAPVLAQHFRDQRIDDLTVVAPDVGSSKMARGYANRLNGELAIVDKRRVSGEEVEVGAVIGDVEGRNVLIIDDMISTAGSIVEAARTVRRAGAVTVRITATHGVLCGPARERLAAAPVDEIVLTDTIPVDQTGLDNLTVLSIAPLLAEAIQRVHEERSISVLFNRREEGMS
ncbi:MAG: ribose-phosphate diphosphokinase [Planctomycetota bacterium]